jgi:2-dehydro-3-deoxyphosphogluconate aldolase / (4S)-4-hydroxy-2-oxoglutarate aldolase
MTRDEVCARIAGIGILPAVRTASREGARYAVESVSSGGIPIVELTLTVPHAVDLIAELRSDMPDVVVGAGTVLTADDARRCLGAGALFLSSPGLDREIVDLARQANVAAIPGALTPTEVIMAWKAGADFVKVFPCAPVGGASYIRALKRPLPQVPLIASGGVNQHTATDFIHAGSAALGIGGELIPREAIERRQTDRIHELARRFLHMVQHARQHPNED